MEASLIKEFHRPREPVLIVEDRKDIRDLLESLCQELEIPTAMAENGEVGMELVADGTFSLYVVDLQMPVMDGRTFLAELKKVVPEPIVLIETSIDTPEIIIDVMKLGVFDYILKPIDPDQFQNSLKRALEFCYLKSLEKNQIENAEQKLRGQLEWLVYKERRLKSGNESQEKNVIHSLQTSLSQGGGIGTMMSIIDMIKTSAKRDEDEYRVNAGLLDLLFENNESGRFTISGLNMINEILSKEGSSEYKKASQIIDAMPGMLERIMRFLESKSLTLSLPDTQEFKDECTVRVDMDSFAIIFEEVIVNALKYSMVGTTVRAMAYKAKGYFCISILNIIDEKKGTGIPKKYEKLVLEPFFRHSPYYDEFGEMDRIGLGLGLTLVDHVIRKLDGLFFIHQATDHTGSQVRECIVADLFLPILQED